MFFKALSLRSIHVLTENIDKLLKFNTSIAVLVELPHDSINVISL